MVCTLLLSWLFSLVSHNVNNCHCNLFNLALSIAQLLDTPFVMKNLDQLSYFHIKKRQTWPLK